MEELIKAHGGKIIQTAEPRAEMNGHTPEVVCTASKRAVSVASLIKRGTLTILQPAWIFDCIDQAKKDVSLDMTEMLLEPEFDRHVYFAPEEKHEIYKSKVDQYGDSYARDTTIEELAACMAKMSDVPLVNDLAEELLNRLFDGMPGSMFRRTRMYFVDCDPDNFILGSKLRMTKTTAKLASAKFVEDLNNRTVTHVVIPAGISRDQVRAIREQVSTRAKVPRFVTTDWIEESWREQTLLDEGRFPAP